MNSDSIVGQILDGKYSIEKELGKGGMGTVYLSTHIGTGRPVALKVIAPDFMKRAEFVERFRREAKAAGRLRHPNVVDVTDFGFSKLANGEDAAYLVMEYLDGCTLGEVLEEERKLPVEFTVNILEQVCSAVEEAHKQGIIHRDLKPDNIWLEPNLRGGYTVKVLDFGIAKLEEAQLEEIAESVEIPYKNSTNTKITSKNSDTLADESQTPTIADKKNSTIISENATMALVEESKTVVAENSEAGTMIQTGDSNPDIGSEAGTKIIQPSESNSSENVNSEDGTSILPSNQTRAIQESIDSKGTKIISSKDDGAKGTKAMSVGSGADTPALKSPSTTNLTRVGAVLGTPLYMSPEQCRGEKLTPRSDIYSLAVIAYQMLSGKLPFTGDYVKVMDGHKNEPPPELKTKKVPKRLKAIVMQSLSKDTAERPVTAEAFASKMRSNSEGIGTLLRRSLVIYSENLPKFLLLTILTFLPLIVLTVLKVILGMSIGFGWVEDKSSLTALSIGLEVIHFFVSIVASAFLVGMMTWIVAQYLAYPLRRLSLRSAFKEVKKRAKSLSFTVGLSTILSFIGYALCLIPGVLISAKLMLIAPSIMMEGIKGKAAFKRSMELTKRSFRTVLATSILVYVIPMLAGLFIGGFIALSNTVYIQSLRSEQMVKEMEEMKEKGVKPQAESKSTENNAKSDINISLNKGEIVIDQSKKKEESEADKEIKKKIGRFGAITQSISQFILLPMLIFLASFTSVITALLYFKTRQAGGESMQELLGKLDDAEQPQSKWQQRVRERLIQSGKITGNTTNPSKP